MASNPSTPWAAYAALLVLVAGAGIVWVRGFRAAKMQQKRLVAGLAVASTPGAIGAIVVQRKGRPVVLKVVKSAKEYEKWLKGREVVAEHWFIVEPKR